MTELKTLKDINNIVKAKKELEEKGYTGEFTDLEDYIEIAGERFGLTINDNITDDKSTLLTTEDLE